MTINNIDAVIVFRETTKRAKGLIGRAAQVLCVREIGKDHGWNLAEFLKTYF